MRRIASLAVALPRTPRARVALIGAVVVSAVAALVASGPIHQPQAYHAFADARPLLGIPNALDVLSNIAFAAAGALGLGLVARGRHVVTERWETAGWTVLFAGLVATAVGSAWYHVAPDDTSLAWDRLPMTIVFGALAALLLGERVAPRLGRAALVPFVVAGAASVAVWVRTGDLRMYAAVQYVPALAAVLALLLLPGRYDRARDLWGALLWYAAAKVCEGLDGAIFELNGVVSGHTLKHVLAAAGAGWFALYLVRRRPLASESSG